jgi:hypothetical protein
MHNPMDIRTTLDNINNAYRRTVENWADSEKRLKELEQKEVEIQNRESSLRSDNESLMVECDRIMELQESVDFQTQKAEIEIEREELQSALSAFEVEKTKFKDSNKEIFILKTQARSKLDAAIRNEEALILREQKLAAREAEIQAWVDSFNEENIKLRKVTERAEKTLAEIRTIDRNSIKLLSDCMLNAAEEEVEEQVKKVAPMIAMLKNIKKEYND